MERMGNPALSPNERFTYRHYRTWPDEERWELIDGHAWAMSPAPMTRHQELSGKLFLEIGLFLKGKPWKVYDAPFDVLLPKSIEADDDVDTVVQPDISIFCDTSKITKRGARGAPDWVIEILSARTAKKDFETKYQLYQRHGVREYWIVDPGAAAIHAWRINAKGLFGDETIYEEGDSSPSVVLEGLIIDVTQLFSDLI
jgi:Uma2 family endonuclease